MTSDFVETGGWRLRHVVAGEGPDVLVLHTLRTQLEHADRIVDELTAHARVHRIDLPGHGRSSKPADGNYSAPAMADAVVGTIDVLGLDPVVVAGESIGGTLALLAGARIPERIAAVVASNPYDSDEGPMIGGPLGGIVTWAAKRSALVAASDRALILGTVMKGGVAKGHRLPADYIELLARTAREENGFGRAQRAVLRASSSWARTAAVEYGNIPPELPTALIYGDQDWASVPHRALNADRIPSVDRYQTMTDTGHFAFMDNPSGVLEHTLPLLTRRS